MVHATQVPIHQPATRLHSSGEARLFGGDPNSAASKLRVGVMLQISGVPATLTVREHLTSFATYCPAPVKVLDVAARHDFWTRVRDFLGGGRTVVLTTHYLGEADALADRIVVLHHGKMLAEGSPAEIKGRVAGRRVRVSTSADPEAVRALPGVRSVERSGLRLFILTSNPEETVRGLMSLDEHLSDLGVSGTGLEEAFLSLTDDHDSDDPNNPEEVGR